MTKLYQKLTNTSFLSIGIEFITIKHIGSANHKTAFLSLRSFTSAESQTWPMGNNKLTHTMELRVEGQFNETSHLSDHCLFNHAWVARPYPIPFILIKHLRREDFNRNQRETVLLSYCQKTLSCLKKKTLFISRAENTKCISVSCWIMYNWWRSKSEAAEYHLPRCRVHFL